MTAVEPRATLLSLLSLNAGYVDTTGFLAFHGLFTAHVTGNFVTLGASLVLGTSGAIAKLLALPMFCAGVIAAGLLNTLLVDRHWPAFEVLIALEVLLLICGALLAVRYGPFHDADSWQAVLSGMILVSAMAIQNASYRVHLESALPSTLKTAPTKQVMVDLADRIHGSTGTESQSSTRLVQMSTNIVLFAIGCGAAALLYSHFGVRCLVVPPMVGILKLVVRWIGWPQPRSGPP